MKYCGIIVLYNAYCTNIKIIESLLTNNIIPIVLDNSTNHDVIELNKNYAETKPSIAYINMHGNKGIAAAQNAGINYAIDNNMIGCFFFDDDSDIDFNYINSMLSEGKKFENDLCILVPRVFSKKTNNEIGNYKNVNGVFECKDLMNSGSFITIKNFLSIGSFDEKLFIDYVDFDFGWRLIKAGGKIKVNQNAILYHSLGEKEFNFCGITFFSSTPIRIFYQTRNAIYLLKKSYSPKLFLCKKVISVCLKSFFLTLILKEINYVREFFKGFKSGII